MRFGQQSRQDVTYVSLITLPPLFGVLSGNQSTSSLMHCPKTVGFSYRITYLLNFELFLTDS